MIKSVAKTIGGTAFIMALWAIFVKYIAVLIGPAGTAFFSFSREYLKLGSFAFSLDSNVAILKSLNYSDDESKKQEFIEFLRKLFTINFCLMGVLFVFIYSLFSQDIFILTGINSELQLLLFLAMFFQSLAYIFNSFLNSIRRLGSMVIAQSLSVLSGLVLLFFMLDESNYQSRVILSILTVSILWMLSSLLFLFKNDFFKMKFRPRTKMRFKFIDNEKSHLKHFLSIVVGTTLVGVGTMLLNLAIKALILNQYGIHYVGIFDSAYTIAVSYILVIMSAVGTFLIPELFRDIDSLKRTLLLKQSFGLLIPIFSIVALIVSLFSHFFIEMLYSSEYVKEGSRLLRYLLFGDLFKILSWVLIAQIMAHKSIIHFVIVSYIWNFLFFGAMFFFCNAFDSIGEIYLWVSISYFIVISIYFSFLSRINALDLITSLVIPIALYVLACYFLLFTTTTFSYGFIGLCIIYSFLSLYKNITDRSLELQVHT